MAQSPTATGSPKEPAHSPFSADPQAELPVGVQLSWRLRALISSGRLAPGEQLPSVRALAGWAEVNVNTVRSVYARLEEDGLAVSQHGLGTFVAAEVQPAPLVEEIAADAIAEARAAGIDPRDLAVVTSVCASVPEIPEDLLQEVPAPRPTRAPPEPDTEVDELPARQELRRQIARLEAELAHYWTDMPEDQIPPPVRGEPHITGIEELERTRDLLLEQIAQAQAAAVRRAERESRARGRLEEMMADPGRHKWNLVASEEVGEPSCKTYEVRPRYGPLGVLMSWWRVKVSGGCPLAGPREAAAGSYGNW
jgi:DNA-binding transcriptional regulator YhcF (GntR family)